MYLQKKKTFYFEIIVENPQTSGEMGAAAATFHTHRSSPKAARTWGGGGGGDWKIYETILICGGDLKYGS